MNKTKYRDLLGRLCYTVKRNDGKIFEVVRSRSNDPVHIVKCTPWMRTAAQVIVEDIIWQEVPPFESFIKAVRWLKENVNDLI